MISLTELWLPILLSAVFVFIVSSILHMVIAVHKDDFKKMPGEEKVLEEMRAQSVQPGSYIHHEFPTGFSAHWVRVVADKECMATTYFVYI